MAKEIRKFQVDFLSASAKYCHQCEIAVTISTNGTASDDEEFSFKASLQQLFKTAKDFAVPSLTHSQISASEAKTGIQRMLLFCRKKTKTTTKKTQTNTRVKRNVHKRS